MLEVDREALETWLNKLKFVVQGRKAIFFNGSTPVDLRVLCGYWRARSVKWPTCPEEPWQVVGASWVATLNNGVWTVENT